MGLVLKALKRAFNVSTLLFFNYQLILFSVLLLLLLSFFSCTLRSVLFSKFLTLPVMVLSTVAFFTVFPRNKTPKNRKSDKIDQSMKDVLSCKTSENQQPEVEVEAFSSSDSKKQPLEMEALSCWEKQLETEISGCSVCEEEQYQKLPQEMWAFEEEETALERDDAGQIEGRAGKSLEFQSESSCISSSDDDLEGSEMEWLLSESKWNGCLNCSISNDEESLIEIALTEAHDLEPQETKQTLRPNLPEFSPEPNFGASLMELFSELTEEDNLIEIDISMGSIKCPRFEIEA